MYTGAAWVLAIVAALVIGVAWTWVWCWLPFVAALVVTMLLLARMQFGPPKAG
jgi:hypothetical protein